MRLIDADTFMKECCDRIEVNAPHLPLYIRDFVIDEMPTVEAEPKWIPITERMPGEKGEYLVTYHPCHWDYVTEGVVKVGVDTFRGKTTWAKKKYQRVIAWRPLPKPYEEKYE